MQVTSMDAEFAHALWEETPDAIIAIAPDGKVLYWNGHRGASAEGALDSDGMQDADKMLGPPQELRVAMLHEPIPDDQAQRDRCPISRFHRVLACATRRASCG